MGASELVIEKKTAVSNVNQTSINWKLIVMGTQPRFQGHFNIDSRPPYRDIS